MATVSFDKQFVVHDAADIERFKAMLERKKPVKVTQRDLKADSEKGIASLRKVLSPSR